MLDLPVLEVKIPIGKISITQINSLNAKHTNEKNRHDSYLVLLVSPWSYTLLSIVISPDCGFSAPDSSLNIFGPITGGGTALRKVLAGGGVLSKHDTPPLSTLNLEII